MLVSAVIDLFMPPLATWLDLAWLAIAVSCLVSHYVWENRKRQVNGRALRATAVFVIVVVLFPYFSASDDVVGLTLLAPRSHQQEEASRKVPFDLLTGARLELGIRLQALANVQATSFYREPETLRARASVPVSFTLSPWRVAPHQASRAPPPV